MAASANALALDFTDPTFSAARTLADRIARGETVDRTGLLAAMTAAFGTGSADGRWSVRDAYDALEIAQTLALRRAEPSGPPHEILARLIDQLNQFPTHSVRSEVQIDFQQFSTPTPIGFLASRLLGIVPGEIVLEPSAGTGLLAIFAELSGARLVLNERDPRRRALLQDAFPDLRVTEHDAEILGDRLPDIHPTAVLINPPFSRSEGRGRDGGPAFSCCSASSSTPVRKEMSCLFSDLR